MSQVRSLPGAPFFSSNPTEDNLFGGLLPFLALTAFLSLTGVMMPGPVFAVTLAKGQRQPSAGAFISLGHGLVELPLVVLIAVGLGRFFGTSWWKLGVGLLGGILLMAVGLDMIRRRDNLAVGKVGPPSSSLSAGLLTTLANPYFFIWWAGIGAGLVARASAWGRAGLAAFYLVHWLSDLGWSLLVSILAHRAGRVWSPRVHRVVFAACGLLLVGCGGWFVWGALRA